jgi:alkanesulfonate monooxygenase SsuD/methylene tetrahydromethanopterin reductase-like flavin-dependent oxidoreductase (luciferase family)
MQICLMIEGQEGVSWEQWKSLARAAEDAGLDGFFRSDHYAAIGRQGEIGALEAWGTLTALAALTSTIRLGTLVSPVTFRSASVLAKLATTADHVSNGRIELGIGAGWFEPEHVAYGFSFLTPSGRLDELDRQLSEIRRQWTEADEIWPKPVQQPHPPIIVGGQAKPRTVRAAIAHADEYNTPGPSVEAARARRAILDRAAAAAGRPALRFSMMIGCTVGRDRPELNDRLARHAAITGKGAPPISGTADEVVAMLRAYADAGVERAMLQHLDHEDVDMVAVLGEVAAELRDSGQGPA